MLGAREFLWYRSGTTGGASGPAHYSPWHQLQKQESPPAVPGGTDREGLVPAVWPPALLDCLRHDAVVGPPWPAAFPLGAFSVLG